MMDREILLRDGELKIPTRITLPDRMVPRRVVLGVHGLGGSMDDEIQQSIAEEMAFFRAACVRFDLPCHGKSPMGPGDFTLDYSVRSLLAAAKFAREAFRDTEGLCVFATGFGAYVTLVALPQLLELTEDIRLVVQTPSVMMHQTLLSMIRMSREDFRAAGSYTFPLAKPFTVTYEFYQELQNNIVLNPQPVPMLILHGERDDYIPMDQIQNFRRINEDSRLVIIPGASHRFLEEGAWDMVLDLTRDWFEFRQVLLADWE